MAVKTPTLSRTCPHCRAWPIGSHEVYCGGCGELALELEIKPEQAILVASLPEALKRPVLLANGGNRDLNVQIRPSAQRSWLSYAPSKLTIQPGKKARFEIHLDPSKLPKEFQIERLQYELILNDNARTRKMLGVTVKAGPKPEASEVVFGELQEGSVHDRQIQMANRGGLPFSIQSVEPFGSGQLDVGDISLPIKVGPGQVATIPVRWDTQVADEGDLTQAGFKVHFAHNEHLVVPARASLFRYRLQTTPERLRFEGSRKSKPEQEVLLQNRGTIDVDVASIRGSEPWIQVNNPYGATQLKAPEPGHATVDTELSFEIICLTQELGPGIHQGQVLIETAEPDLENLALDIELRVAALEAYPDYLGIDFGTTNSVVSFLGADRSPKVVELEDNGSSSPLIPSLLYFHELGNTYIGHRAKNASGGDPDRIVRSIKRVMGYDEGVQINEHKYRPEEIAAAILKHLVRYGEDCLFKTHQRFFDVRRAIITVPANFYGLQIQAILEACSLAGLETGQPKLAPPPTSDPPIQPSQESVQETPAKSPLPSTLPIILDEPSAAAIYFIDYLVEQRGLAPELEELVNRDEGMHILVYDHGGGTLDVSVARVTRQDDGSVGLSFLANRGDNRLGGDHLDILIMRDLLIGAKLEASHFDTSLIEANHSEIQRRREAEGWSADDWVGVVRARHVWKEAAEQLKISLAGGTTQTASESLPGWALIRFENGHLIRSTSSVELSLDSSQLFDRLNDALAKSARLIKQTLELAGVQGDAIDFVLHAGRQSLLNLIKENVSACFPNLPSDRLILDPTHLLKTCVAKGAALYGRSRDSNFDGGVRILQEGRALPHAYGVDRTGTFGQIEFDEVIPRGEAYPIRREKIFDSLPPTGRLSLRIYENGGTSRHIRGNEEITEAGHFEHRFDPAAVDQLRVRFEIDNNRQLKVHIEDRVVEIRPVQPAAELDWMG